MDINELVKLVGRECGGNQISNGKAILNISSYASGKNYKQNCEALANASRLNSDVNLIYAKIFSEAAKAKTKKEAVKILKGFLS